MYTFLIQILSYRPKPISDSSIDNVYVTLKLHPRTAIFNISLQLFDQCSHTAALLNTLTSVA